MDFNYYQKSALRTSNDLTGETRLAYLALGLAGEAGEVTEHIKKFIAHGESLDVEQVCNELGDVLWYIAVLADALRVKLSDIAIMNIEKLALRYPSGFSPKTREGGIG